MERVIYLYRMPNDTGNAPCVYKADGVTATELLSVVCCKGGGVRKDGGPIRSGLRREVGKDAEGINAGEKEVWLAAVYRGNFIYAARLSKVIPMREYFSGEAFEGRLDGIYRVREDAPPEAEYDYLVRREDVNADFHPAGERLVQMRDELGKWALLSDHFVYLGEEAAAVRTPEAIRALFPGHRGQRRYDLDSAEGRLVMDFVTHLPQWPGGTGCYAAKRPSERAAAGCQD